jgi:hypothetical protein
VGLDDAPALGRVASAIGEAQALAVAAGAGDGRQGLGVDRRAGAGGEGHGRRLQRVDAPAQVGGEHLLELDQRADGGLLDPGHRRAGRGAQADRDGDGLVVVQEQRRHRGSGVQPVAAGRPGQRVDRIAELAQALDVAADGAPRDLQTARELAAGPVATRLQQREELEEAAGSGGHDPRASISCIAASI